MLGVEPLLHLDQIKLGILHAVGFDKGNILERGGLLQQDRLKARQAGGALNGSAEFRGVNLQSAGDAGDAVGRKLRLRFAQQENAEGGEVIRQDAAIAVKDAPARRDDGKVADTVTFRQLQHIADDVQFAGANNPQA